MARKKTNKQKKNNIKTKKEKRKEKSLVPSCRLASIQVGSWQRKIITASITFSTKAGGRPYDLISVMSFLLRDSKA
jgi:hypothetical protein